MRRRAFITLFGGAAAAWPFAAHAQSERVRRVGVLMGIAADDSEAQLRRKAFESAWSDLGWVAGRNITVDYRWAPGDQNAIRKHAAELVASSPDIILAAGTPVLAAVREATQSIPIVFVGISDPEGTGVVASLARPGGNITGFANFEPAISGKWLQALKEIAPHVTHAGILRNANALATFLPIFHKLGPAFGIEPMDLGVRNAAELERAIRAHATQPNFGLIVLPDPMLAAMRRLNVELAATLRIPTVYPLRLYVVDGGLIAYGINMTDQFRPAAFYIDRILKGAKPSDLPVQAPTKFEMVINLKTAKALGLAVPLSLLGRADEVIE